MSAEFDNNKTAALASLEKIRHTNGGSDWERERLALKVENFVNQWAGVAAAGNFEQDKAEALADLEAIRAVSTGDGWERERLVRLVESFIDACAGVADE